MTCVAWDGMTLAADKRSTGDHLMTVSKIFRLPNGDLVGFAGVSENKGPLLKWFNEGENPENYPRCQSSDKDSSSILKITKDGQIFRYGSSPYPYKLEDTFAAIGSAGPMAIGAMAAGMLARTAVEVCCKYDAYCGNGIDTLTLE